MSELGRNISAADQLAEVRSQIKHLKLRERKLCDELVAKGGERGAFVEAIVNEIERRSIDTAAVRAELGNDALRFEKVSYVTTVRLEDLR
jgi:hypothetical protein